MNFHKVYKQLLCALSFLMIGLSHCTTGCPPTALCEYPASYTEPAMCAGIVENDQLYILVYPVASNRLQFISRIFVVNAADESIMWEFRPEHTGKTLLIKYGQKNADAYSDIESTKLQKGKKYVISILWFGIISKPTNCEFVF